MLFLNVRFRFISRQIYITEIHYRGALLGRGGDVGAVVGPEVDDGDGGAAQEPLDAAHLGLELGCTFASARPFSALAAS